MQRLDLQTALNPDARSLLTSAYRRVHEANAAVAADPLNKLERDRVFAALAYRLGCIETVAASTGLPAEVIDRYFEAQQ